MNSIQSIFSIKRFGLLIRREVIMKRSFLLIASVGLFIAITAVTLFILGVDRNYRSWDINKQSALFLALFAICGIVFSGTAFPAFRNSKKTMDYLLIPNSMTEKYLFEVLFRILIYILVFPVLFWLAANFAGAIFNSFTTTHYELGYNLWTPFKMIHKEVHFTQGEVTIYAMVLFLISIPFTGSAFFSKAPLFKTLIFLAVLIGTYWLYGWILDEIFGFTHAHGFDPDITKETGMNIVTSVLVFSTLVLHASAFFRLKEKEV
ncbi:hypothetical protein ACE01N_15825 [Saccharicrinis sp. FJH2]|uniref:hypothetical protein n=1 Tax=unclassified Saccharicrinis TaxID=2646859 RepID=UPI0035D47169